MKEALKLALESLEWFTAAEQGDEPPINKAITAIKEALAQPEQEPVAYIRKDQLQKAAQSAMLCEVTPEPRQDRIAIYTTPPKRPWVGLTNEDMYELGEFANTHGYVPTPAKRMFAKIEAKLKEKNT